MHYSSHGCFYLTHSVVYMCQKSLNFTNAFKCYHQNVSGFTLAEPPCRLHITIHWFNVIQLVFDFDSI